jgi:plastocyanin
MKRSLVALAAAAIAAVGCNTAPPATPAGASSVAGASPPQGPHIVGTVLVAGAGTEKKPPVQGGAVYLEDAPKQQGVATMATVLVDHKEFTPFLSVITTGATVTFGNKDGVVHHVFSPDIPGWDTGNLQKGQTSQRTFDAPGPVALLCNIHPEMLAYVLVVPSTYFGTLAADGTYFITNVPPGTYRATAWAPRMKPVTQSVTVPAEGPVTANFELSGTTN